MSGPPKSNHSPAIPAWQRSEKAPLADSTSPSSTTTSTSTTPSSTPTSTSTTPTSTPSSPADTPDSSTTSKTDGSQIAAKQEFDASQHIPTPLAEHADPPHNRSDTDGTQVAASQEYQASQTSLDQVRQFLDHPRVRDAPAEKKLAFLKDKHVPADIIAQLLPDDSESSSSTPSAASPSVSPSSPQPAFSPADFQATLSTRSVSPPVQRDLPPIVTYPEFLIQPQSPPPLVTLDRLLSTAYITGGLAATTYALSKFVISPMLASLTEARHDFAQHSSSRLIAVNEKLSGLVSVVPPSKTATAPPSSDDFDDLESTVSDPTELFHRDFGTQTSPLPSPDPDSSTSSATLSVPETLVSKHQTRLSIVKSHLSELLADCEANGDTNQHLQSGISDFRHYLDNVVYSPPAYQYHPGETVFTPPGMPKDKKDDVVAAFKAEIRGVKGVLLSAKRFPSAAAVR